MSRLAAARRLAFEEPGVMTRQFVQYPRALVSALQAGRRLRRERPGLESVEAALDLCWNFEWLEGDVIPMQQRDEVGPLLALLERDPPRVIVEIGSFYGGTLLLWTRVAAPDALIVSIDIQHGVLRSTSARAALLRGFARDDQRVVTLFGRDSTKPSTRRKLEQILGGRKIDFLFIDGDHHYDAVSADFALYRDLVRSGGLIGFHDIHHLELPDCQTAAFWRDFKQEHETDEIFCDSEWKMGIGLYRPV